MGGRIGGSFDSVRVSQVRRERVMRFGKVEIPQEAFISALKMDS